MKPTAFLALICFLAIFHSASTVPIVESESERDVTKWGQTLFAKVSELFTRTENTDDDDSTNTRVKRQSPIRNRGQSSDSATRTDPTLLETDKSATELETKVSLAPNSDSVQKHDFKVLTEQELSAVAQIFAQQVPQLKRFGEMLLRAVVGFSNDSVDKSVDRQFNLESEVDSVAEEDRGDVQVSETATSINDDQKPLDDFIDYRGVVPEEAPLNARSRQQVPRPKRSASSDMVSEDDSSDAQSDLEVRFPDTNLRVAPKKIKLPSGVNISIEPGQHVTIKENGELITQPSSTKAKVKGHPAPSITLSTSDSGSSNTEVKMDKHTLSTARRPGWGHPEEHVPINPKVSGLVALLQKSVSDGYFRRPMDRDVPIQQIQVNLKNGTRLIYEMQRDVKAVDHTLKGQCDPLHDPGCQATEANAGNLHVHLTNGSTINYSFKKASQLDPASSIDSKERTLKIKMYVAAATTLDDLLFRTKSGPEDITDDKIHFEEVFLEELGKKLRDTSFLIPTKVVHNQPVGGIIGNEPSIPTGDQMPGGSGEALSSTVEHYMGLLSSEHNRVHGLVGDPPPMSERMDLGALTPYAIGASATIVVFMAIGYLGAHYLETCAEASGRLSTANKC